MQSINSYTGISQSKTLSKILPLESADMCLTFVNKVWNPVWGKADDIYQLQKDCYEPDYTKDDYVDIDEFEPKVVPCWSLAALLDVLPNGIVMNKDSQNGRYHFSSTHVGTYVTADNPIDVCYELILKLHELNLL